MMLSVARSAACPKRCCSRSRCCRVSWKLRRKVLLRTFHGAVRVAGHDPVFVGVSEQALQWGTHFHELIACGDGSLPAKFWIFLEQFALEVEAGLVVDPEFVFRFEPSGVDAGAEGRARFVMGEV